MFVYRRTGLDGLVAVVGGVWGIVAVVKLDDHPLLPAPKDVVMVHRAQDNLLGLISLSGDDLNRDSLSYSIFRSGLGALGRDTRASEAVDAADALVAIAVVFEAGLGLKAHLAPEAVVVVVAKAVVSEAGEDVLALGLSLGGVDLLCDEGALLLEPGGALLVLNSVVLLLMNIFLNSPRNNHTALL